MQRFVTAVLIAAIFAALCLMPGCGSKIGSVPISCSNCSTNFNNFLYTANAAGSPSTVSALASSQTTGAVTAIAGSPYSTGTQSLALAADPTHGFLYVANAQSSNITAFSRNPTNGTLSAVTGSPFAAELGMDSVAIDPFGQFLYAVTGNSANPWAYSISGSTGALTPLPGIPMAITPGGGFSTSVVIDPSGKYLYVANGGSPSGSLYGFSRDTTTGALTALSGFPIPLDGFPNTGAAFGAAGNFLLVTGNNVFGTAGGVDVFSLNASTGALTRSLGSPVQVGDGPAGIALDFTGRFAYIPNTADATISAFNLTGTGGLTAIAGSPFPSGGKGSINGPLGIATDNLGKFVYVCNAANDVSVFSANSGNGVLTPITGSLFPDGGNAPSAIVFVS